MQTKRSDPLLQSVLFISQFHGYATTADALVSGLPLKNNRLTPSLVERSAERANLSSRATHCELQSIRTSLLPAVILLNDNYCCVLTKLDKKNGTAQVVYPELNSSPVDLTLEELSEEYSGTTLFMRPKFQFDLRSPRLGKRIEGHWFWAVFRSHKKLYIDVFLAAFMINIFALALPFFTMNVYDRVVPNYAIETLWMLAIGIGIVLFMELVLKSLRSYFLDLANQKIDVTISANIMEHVLGIRLEHRPASAGAFAVNLRAFESIRDFITSITLAILIDIPFLIIFLVVVFWIAPIMTIPMLIAALFIIAYGFFVQRHVQDLTESSYRAMSLRNGTLIESLVGLETLKAIGAESHIQKSWESATAFLAKTGVQQRLLAQSNGHISAWAQQMASVSVVIIGVYLIEEGILSMGGLIACSMLATRGIAPLAQASGLLLQYNTAKTAMLSLNELMATPVERPPQTKFITREKLKGEIEFRDVSFSYPGSATQALKKVSFHLKAGEHVAILGRNGCGKSTLSKLILGLYQPTEGAVLIDGIDIRQIDPGQLRHQLGASPQDTTLFYGTLRDNLCIANPSVNDERILKAAEVADLTDFVNRHPEGFDLLIGERGESLSGGQRKAVGIARAVINDPSLLVFDEPTASMDHTTESNIKKNLIQYCKNKSLLIITHRSALLDMVDKIIVIDNGQIVANGPKETVIEALRSGRIGRA